MIEDMTENFGFEQSCHSMTSITLKLIPESRKVFGDHIVASYIMGGPTLGYACLLVLDFALHSLAMPNPAFKVAQFLDTAA